MYNFNKFDVNCSHCNMAWSILATTMPATPKCPRCGTVAILKLGLPV